MLYLYLVPDQRSYVSVEELASGIATLPKLHRIRKAVSELRKASAKLDVEKAKVEKAFHKAVRNLPRGRFGHRTLRRIKNWIQRHLGIGAPLPEHNDTDLEFPALHTLNTIWDTSIQDLCKSRKGRFCDLIKAAIRVKTVNQKLILFERGFISEEGVKDREWFRHLGVAPGKYSGKSL